jgi:RHS repeat-associated protein
MSPLNLPQTNSAFRPRPANVGSPPHPPLIGPTGSPGVNSVLDVVNSTVAPFMNAPPAEQGVAGVVAQGLGGVLGVVGAPAMIIDTAFASLTAPIAAMFPSMPAVTLLGMHVGTPHAHTHPPSLIPPAPPVPLPSLGALVGSGAVTVLIGGMPAARAGDIGIAVTCGSLAPPFEVFTGSSNVFIGGARAARILDITKHCNPTSMGPFAIAMSAAGVVAGAAGAIASSNLHVAAQAAADAAVLAIKLLCGKDPGIPPGMGTLVGPPVPNVMIGGFPCPPIGEMAMGGLMRAIGKAVAAVRRARSPRRSNGQCADGLHPIYLPTGEYFDSFVDFISGVFEWKRHYSSARAAIDGPLGHGFRHFLQRSLSIRLHRATYTDWDGVTIEFPRFQPGLAITRSDGYVLRRESATRYSLTNADAPTMEFTGRPFEGELRLTKLRDSRGELELLYDATGQLASCVDRKNERGWEFTRDAHGHIVNVQEMRIGGDGHAVNDRTSRAQYRYSEAGNLVDARDALGGVWSYHYEAHRIVKQTDPRGYSFSFTYDVLGRCVAAAGQDGLWAGTIEYVADKRVTRCTTGERQTWQYHYDHDGFVTKIIDPHGGAKTRVRDDEGRVREVDAGGRELEWLYDADGAHFGRRDGYGVVHPPEAQDRNLQKPFARKLPDTSRLWSFAGNGERAAPTTFRSPDALLETIPRHHIAALSSCIQFDQSERVAHSPLRFEYDALGQIVGVVDGLGRTRAWQRDRAGNIVSVRDRDGRIRERKIGSWNLVTADRDALGHGLRYQYSSTETIVGVEDPLGNVSRYDYDRKNRLVAVRRNDHPRERYVYENDHFVAKHGGDGAVLFTNQIHANHRVALRQLATGGIHRYDYDAGGRMTAASTAEHDVRLAYDECGRRVADRRDGAGVRHRIGHASYDTRILDRFVIAAGQPNHQTVKLVDPTGGVTMLNHYEGGIVERLCSNGTVEILQYDGDGKLAGRLAYGTGPGASGAGWSVRYTYSAEGDLLRVADSIRGETAYETDAAHRLVSKITDAPHHELYEYDAASNVVSLGGRDRATIREGNCLAAFGTDTFEYDERDRQASRRSAGGALTRYIYDSFDMLVRIERTSKDDTRLPDWEARYDGLGRRLRTQVGAAVREFYWDGDRLAAEIFPDKTLRIYQYGGREALVPLQFTDYAHRDASPATGRTYHVFSDQVGMPLQIQDQRGTVVWWAEDVSPHGTIKVRQGATIEYNLRWPGHYFDPESGLHCNRYRYYDPRIARYLQPDPLDYNGSPVNLYGYCSNPIVDVDVLGLTTCKTDGDFDAEEVTKPNIKVPVIDDIDFRSEHVNGGSIRITGERRFRDGVKADLQRIETTPTGRQLLGEIQDNHRQHGTTVDIGMGIPGSPKERHSENARLREDGSRGTPSNSDISYVPQNFDPSGNMTSQSTSDRHLVHELDHGNRAGRGESQTHLPADPDGVRAPNRDEQLAVNRENQYARERNQEQRRDYDHVPGLNDAEFPPPDSGGTPPPNSGGVPQP